jgi:hypothetical protein
MDKISAENMLDYSACGPLSELSSFLKNSMENFGQKAHSRSHIKGFPIIYIRNLPERSGKGREPGFEKISTQSPDRRTDGQGKAVEIVNNRQTVVSVKDATIKRTTIQIRCDGEYDDGVL